MQMIFLQKKNRLIVFESKIFPTNSIASPSTTDDHFDRTLTAEHQATSSPIRPTQGK